MTRVLIVDDQARNRYMLEVLLRGHGYEVVSAANGAEALGLARTAPPALIVTDILMPVMDGFALCREWRADERLKDIPFVFYTATYTDTKDEQFALGLGADRYVIKPAEPEALAKIVNEVLEQARESKSGSLGELLSEELEFLKRHNDALFRKLEHKMAVLESEIADRKQAELALRQSEGFLERIIENIPDMVFVKEAASLRFVRLNRATEDFLGRPKEQLTGKSDRDLFPAEQADHFVQQDREALTSGRLLDIPEEAIQTPHKAKRLFHTKKIPILDEAGQPRFLLGISEDVTERKRLEDRLRQSQKMEAIGLLAGGVAHDFNNLLGVIIGHGDLLSRVVPPGDPGRSHVEMILSTAERAASLTRQLLIFSRRQVVKPTRLEVEAVVAAVDKLLRRLIGEQVELVTRCAPGLGAVVADQGQLEQVLMNLAINARDAMPNGGRLVIEARNADLGEIQGNSEVEPGAQRPAVALSVSDTGVGISAEVRARLFEPFFTTKPAGKGTGLGLTTVREIVKQFGGQVKVESEVDHGTTFTVYLPRALAEAAAKPAAEGRPAAGKERGIGSETIALVEDETALGVVMTEVLEDAGYTVICTASPSEALRCVAAWQGEVHLLLTDVVMPEMSGPQLAQRVQALRPGLRVLYMSGYSDDAVGRAARGGARWVEKPFSQQRLLSEVRRTLDEPPPNGAPA